MGVDMEVGQWGRSAKIVPIILYVVCIHRLVWSFVNTKNQTSLGWWGGGGFCGSLVMGLVPEAWLIMFLLLIVSYDFRLQLRNISARNSYVLYCSKLARYRKYNTPVDEILPSVELYPVCGLGYSERMIDSCISHPAV